MTEKKIEEEFFNKTSGKVIAKVTMISKCHQECRPLQHNKLWVDRKVLHNDLDKTDNDN